jgi:1,4-dihydroxy-2-naphthoyl-CoA hydrolase
MTRDNDVTLVEKLQARLPPYPAALGMEFTEAGRDRLVARMTVRADMCNGTSFIHGGALMTFADTLGAVATIINIAPDKWTTTLESKTNFVSPGPEGAVLIGAATPLHRGGRTQVWETCITTEDGRPVAKVTQTQMVLDKKPEARA